MRPKTFLIAVVLILTAAAYSQTLTETGPLQLQMGRLPSNRRSCGSVGATHGSWSISTIHASRKSNRDVVLRTFTRLGIK